MAVQPLVFLSIYYSMTLPALPFVQLYGVGVLVVWYCTSAGTLLSLVAPPSSALMATAALLMVGGVGVWGGGGDVCGGASLAVGQLCHPLFQPSRQAAD